MGKLMRLDTNDACMPVVHLLFLLLLLLLTAVATVIMLSLPLTPSKAYPTKYFVSKQQKKKYAYAVYAARQ